ncbi:MAG: type II secretion system protein [Hydrogenophilales bacterium]|nr:type II secretion system protein [Hydrogenophilales bacterium]
MSAIENRRFCGGFTMVELILVIVVAGILAAVAVPRLIGRNAFDERGFADQLASTVRFAQKLAVAQHTHVYVRLTASDATLCYDPACTNPAPGPGGEKPYTIGAPNGVAIASPVAVLDFDAGGRPVNIMAQLDIPINGTSTHHVYVEQETGYVHD